jgi:hypothetical protein
LKVLNPKSDRDILNDYYALPEEIKTLAKEYWMNVAEGIDFRVLYDEAYRTGYEDCERKWREIL